VADVVVVDDAQVPPPDADRGRLRVPRSSAGAVRNVECDESGLVDRRWPFVETEHPADDLGGALAERLRSGDQLGVGVVVDLDDVACEHPLKRLPGRFVRPRDGVQVLEDVGIDPDVPHVPSLFGRSPIRRLTTFSRRWLSFQTGQKERQRPVSRIEELASAPKRVGGVPTVGHRRPATGLTSRRADRRNRGGRLASTTTVNFAAVGPSGLIVRRTLRLKDVIGSHAPR
jgi:hypothetical protein